MVSRQFAWASGILPDPKIQEIQVRGLFLSLVLATALSACASTAIEDAAESDDVTAIASRTEPPKQRCYREKRTGFRLGGARICEPARVD